MTMTLPLALPSWSHISLAGVVVAIGGLTTYYTFRAYLLPLFSPLRVVPGPDKPHWFTGHFGQIITETNTGDTERKWMSQFGPVFRFKAFFNDDRLWVCDVRAIQHILQHHFIYTKPQFLRYHLSQILGDGLLIAEGVAHRNQRRVMNPAFSNSHIREMTTLFVSKSAELKDCLLDQISASPTPGQANIEIISWLSRATLDIIGLAGFDYSFDALKFGEDSNELGAAFAQIFNSAKSTSVFNLLQGRIPILQRVTWDKQSRTTAQAQKTMRRIGMQLVHEKQQAVREEKASGGGTALEKGKDKDLLSLLIKANMDKDLPPQQQLTVEQILNQIPTFLVAGHETTSTSTTWTLYALACQPKLQTKLREELQAFPHDSPTMDDLNSFQYLDAVVRETLRLYSAVDGTIRVATEADVIPLSKPFTGRDGALHNEIRISKGETIILPISFINTSPEIWGEDAREFNPERWFKDIPGGNVVPGVWANLLSFIGGARACIGYRFALVEMKALLFQLIRSLEFELDAPVEDVARKSIIVTRPYLISEKEKGNQLPMIIRPVRQ